MFMLKEVRFFIIMLHLQIINRNRRRRENQRIIFVRRTMRDNSNPFALPERRFIELFRLDKELAQEFVNVLGAELLPRRNSRGISLEIKVLTTLRFLATGSYQRCVGEEYNFGLNQTSVHICLHSVVPAIVRIWSNKISFPSTREERNATKEQFLNNWGFPGTVGVIDCTHVAILKPAVDEHNFMNRKDFHSNNCQIICNADMKILNIYGNFGGANHDSFIFSQSAIKRYIENLYQQGERLWLIGDSGYPQLPILMTPFRNAIENSPESRYNMAHISARNCVERCIGLLKMRFRCLTKERVLRYEPAFVAEIITACAILHNVCITNNINIIGNAEQFANENIFREVVLNQVAQRMEGIRAKQIIVNRYFA